MIAEKRWRHPDVKEGLCSLSGLRPEVARLVLDHYQKDPIMARKNGDPGGDEVNAPLSRTFTGWRF